MNGPLSPPSCLVVSSFLRYLVACFFGIITQPVLHVHRGRTTSGRRRRQAPRQGDVGIGSIVPFYSSANYFRSSPANGHPQGRSRCLKGPTSEVALASTSILREDVWRKM